MFDFVPFAGTRWKVTHMNIHIRFKKQGKFWLYDSHREVDSEAQPEPVEAGPSFTTHPEPVPVKEESKAIAVMELPHDWSVPSCAQWFDMDRIHQIEEESLPEFFSGKYRSKTPNKYAIMRNFIINLY